MKEIIELESKIAQVEVFRSESLITRRARLADVRRSGEVVIRLAPLPFLLLDNSLRIKVASSGVRVVDVHVELDLGRRDGPILTQAQQKLRDLIFRRHELSIAKERVRLQLDYLSALEVSERDESSLPDRIAFSKRQPMMTFQDLANYVVEFQHRGWPRFRDLERQLVNMEDEIAKAQAELSLQRQAELDALAVCRKAVRVQLELKDRLDAVDLEMSYVVPASRWVPEYELRVDPLGDRAELVAKALLTQRTGEDWSQVSLVFSTANLRRSTDLPELESWRIGKAQPPKTSGWRKLPETLDELFTGYDQNLVHLSQPQLPDTIQLPKNVERIKNELSSDAIEENLILSAVSELDSVDDLGKSDEIQSEPHMDDADESRMVSMAPPMAMAAPAPKHAYKKSGRLFSKKVAEEVCLDDLEESEPSGEMWAEAEERVELSSSALGFANLRMQDPQVDQRGQLKAVSQQEQVSELIAEFFKNTHVSLATLPTDLVAPIQDTTLALRELVLPEFAVDLEQSAAHFAARYPKEGLASVDSDGKFHTMSLLRRSDTIRRIYRCVPRLDTTVYQLAEFKNPLGMPLLAGPVRVYKGGDFIVSAPLGTTEPGRTMTINLGVEPGISVARNVEFNESVSGLMGGQTDLEHRIVIEANNKLGRAVILEVFERIPVSNDDNINIQIVETDPPAEKYEQAERGHLLRGGRKFRLELEPGEIKTCTLVYKISIPSKQVLKGGNRRG